MRRSVNTGRYDGGDTAGEEMYLGPRRRRMMHSREVARCFSEEQFWGRGGDTKTRRGKRREKRREKRCEHAEAKDKEEGGNLHFT